MALDLRIPVNFENKTDLKVDMIYIFCKFITAVSGTEMVQVASAPFLGKALDQLRKQYKAGVAVHHPHFGKELFYTNGWQGPYIPLITA